MVSERPSNPAAPRVNRAVAALALSAAGVFAVFLLSIRWSLTYYAPTFHIGITDGALQVFQDPTGLPSVATYGWHLAASDRLHWMFSFGAPYGRGFGFVFPLWAIALALGAYPAVRFARSKKPQPATAPAAGRNTPPS